MGWFDGKHETNNNNKSLKQLFLLFWRARYICHPLPPLMLFFFFLKCCGGFVMAVVAPVFFPWYFTLNLFPDLVDTHKVLPAFHLSAQRLTKLPEQPLKDPFLSQGELFHFQSLQISLCTVTGLPTSTTVALPLLCGLWSSDLLKEERRAQITFPLVNLRSSVFFSQSRLDVKRWMSLGQWMHLAVADHF